MTALLEIKGVSKRYGQTQALQDVHISGRAGNIHALVGENGAGKSTLLKILSGVVKADAGEIAIEGQIVELDTPTVAQSLGIRTVHQEFSLIPHLSVAENILLGRIPSNGPHGWVSWSKVYDEAERILQQIGFGQIEVTQRVDRLSVPQQQMVEIAKAVAAQVRVLVLDEPAAVLSTDELKGLFDLVRKLAEQGTLVFYVSHRLEEVFEIADCITVLRDGRVVDTVKTQDIDSRRLVRMMVGRTLDDLYPDRTPQPGDNVLTVSSLRCEGQFYEVSFSLAQGEILGLFGLMGGGQTQVARAIFGAQPVTSGEIRLQGADRGPRTPREAVEASIAYLTEDRKRSGLVLSATLRDNISLAAFKEVAHFGFIDRAEQHSRITSLVERLDVRPPDIDRPVATLSGGNQQKVAFAKWLMRETRILILSEPTRGVDIGTKAEIYQLIADLAEQGVAILFISSEMPEILGVSDRVLVMRRGHMVAEFARSEAEAESVLAAATGVAS